MDVRGAQWLIHRLDTRLKVLTIVAMCWGACTCSHTWTLAVSSRSRALVCAWVCKPAGYDSRSAIPMDSIFPCTGPVSCTCSNPYINKHIELPAKLLDCFLRSTKRTINQSTWMCGQQPNLLHDKKHSRCSQYAAEEDSTSTSYPRPDTIECTQCICRSEDQRPRSHAQKPCVC